jgi:hypothetical protein
LIAYQSQTVVSLSWYTGRGATVIRYQQLYILRFIWPNGAEALFTYLPTGRYDCTAFMETGSVGLRCNLIGVLVNVNVESPAATSQQCFQKCLLPVECRIWGIFAMRKILANSI